MFFSFPEDARWNPDLQSVEFGVSIGEYEGVVHVPRDVFRRFTDGAVTPEKCLEAYYLQRTRFELIAERKLRRRHWRATATSRSAAATSASGQPRRLSPPPSRVFTGLFDEGLRQAVREPIAIYRCASGSACHRRASGSASTRFADGLTRIAVPTAG